MSIKVITKRTENLADFAAILLHRQKIKMMKIQESITW